MNALERKLYMLRIIPRHPKKIDCTYIEDKLRDHNVEIDKRTIQRDLNNLSGMFPIVCDQKRPYGWSWMPDAELFDIPKMDPISALTFRMAEDFLSSLMPPATFRSLRPHFNQASIVLNNVKADHLQTWPDKIKVLSRSQKLAAPHIDESVIETVYESLLEGKRFSAVYRRRGETGTIEYTVNPLGIVVLDTVIYLVCTMRDYDQLKDVRQLSIHRIISAEKLDSAGKVPDTFNLQNYIDSGAFGYLQHEETIKLKAVFEKNIAMHLIETALSDDQVITYIDSEKVMIEASVLDTAQLRWWLLGFGEKVEVIEPATLRDEFREKAEKMFSCYSKRQ